MDPLILEIEGHARHRIVIDRDLNVMLARAWHLTHFALHGVVAAAGEPVDNGTDDEVRAKFRGKAIEFVNIALSIANVNTPIGSPQESDRLAQIIEPANTLFYLDRDPRRVDSPLELRRAFELVPVPEFDRGQTARKPLLGDD